MSAAPALPRVWTRLLEWVRPQLPGLLLALAVALGTSALRYLRAYLAKPFLDDVVLGGAPYAGVLLLAAALVVAIPATELLRTLLTERILGRIRMGMEREACAKLLALPLGWQRRSPRGDLLSRALRDLDTAHAALRTLLGDLGVASAMVLAGGATLLLISWQLSALLLLTLPLLFALTARFGRRIRQRARRRQEAWGELTQRLVEILDGLPVIRAFGASGHERDAFRASSERLFRRSLRVVRERVLARSAVEVLNGAAVLAVLALGAALVRGGRFGLTAGDLFAFGAALFTLYRPIKTLAKSWVRLADAEPAAMRLFDLLDAPEEAGDPPDAVRLERLRRGVRLCGVSSQREGRSVLREVSFEIRRGEVVALVGRSGAGKSTVAELLLRFESPSRGRIEVDGIDLQRISLPSWRTRVAWVGQEPFLFDASIAENVRYGRREASRAELRAALRAAQVEAFAESLPAGLETRVGPGGARLSGGERQRVAIARALLSQADLLILDEATSSLDLAHERGLQAALESLSGQRAVLVIAHRPSTVRRASRVVVLDAGRVVQCGSPAELAARPGPYRSLFGEDPSRVAPVPAATRSSSQSFAYLRKT